MLLWTCHVNIDVDTSTQLYPWPIVLVWKQYNVGNALIHCDNGDGSIFHCYVSKELFCHNSILFEDILDHVSDMDHMLLYKLHNLDNDFGIQSPNAPARLYLIFSHENCFNCISTFFSAPRIFTFWANKKEAETLRAFSIWLDDCSLYQSLAGTNFIETCKYWCTMHYRSFDSHSKKVHQLNLFNYHEQNCWEW